MIASDGVQARRFPPVNVAGAIAAVFGACYVLGGFVSGLCVGAVARPSGDARTGGRGLVMPCSAARGIAAGYVTSAELA